MYYLTWPTWAEDKEGEGATCACQLCYESNMKTITQVGQGGGATCACQPCLLRVLRIAPS